MKFNYDYIANYIKEYECLNVYLESLHQQM